MEIKKAIEENETRELNILINEAKWSVDYHTAELAKAQLRLEIFEKMRREK